MKKLLLICALMAFAAAAASAELTFIGGGKTSYYGNPINPGCKYSGAQCLYTNAELNSLYHVASDGTVTSAEISSVTFYMYVNYIYAGDFTVTAYAQNIDDIAFALDPYNNLVMFDYQSGVKGSKTFTYDDMVRGNLGEAWENTTVEKPAVVPVTINFADALKYNGKSIVFTFVCESNATNNELFSIDIEKFPGWAPGVDTRSLIYSDGTYPMTTAYKQSDRYLPNLSLDYTVVTEKPAQVATIGTVSVKVGTVACEPSLGLNSEANVLQFSFKINDPADVGSYDITLNSVNLGTNDKYVTISFINPKPTQDYVIGITPKAEGVIGSTVTVTKNQIAPLFPTPSVKVTDWHLLSEYNATDEKANVSASLLCTVSGIGGAARYSNDDWCASLSSGCVGLWGNQAQENNIPDFLAELQPATATDDNFNALKANDYQFAVAKLNWLQDVDVDDAKLAPISEHIGFKSTICQPVAYLDTPTLGTAPASINGNDYKCYDFTSKVSVSATLTSTEDHIKTNVTFPEALKIKVNEANSSIVCYAPEGSTLWYRIVEITDEAEDTPETLLMAEAVWHQAASNPWRIGKADLSFDAIIELKTVDNISGAESEVTSMLIKQNGEISSAATIEADSNDAVRYFTPMGVEITPEAIIPGTLYIRRTATGATKHLAR